MTPDTRETGARPAPGVVKDDGVNDEASRMLPTFMSRSFPDRESAERAYDAILARGYASGDVHVLMSDDARRRHFAADAAAPAKGRHALEGAGVGGAVGGTVGATLVAIAATAGALTVPGLGLVIAGPLAGALAGGATGAAAGGLAGLLVGAGLPEEDAERHARDLEDGRIVLGVAVKHHDDARHLDTEWSRPHVPNTPRE